MYCYFVKRRYGCIFSAMQMFHSLCMAYGPVNYYAQTERKEIASVYFNDLFSDWFIYNDLNKIFWWFMKTSKRKEIKCQGHKLKLVNTHVIKKYIKKWIKGKWPQHIHWEYMTFIKLTIWCLWNNSEFSGYPDSFGFEMKDFHSIF